jgi:hypothetical protein
MRILAKNRRRWLGTDRDVENKMIEIVVMGSILFFCTSLLLFTLADVACAPAARSVPANTSLLSPYNQQHQRPSSEQAGEMASFYRENF